MTPRGIRNRNPGNIRHSENKWRGMAEEQPDPAFVTFQHPVYGIRALARILLTYRNRHGLKTIRETIGRWAPPVENDTDAYVASVAAAVGLGPDDPLVLDGRADSFRRLVAAIIRHENGEMPYGQPLIDDAIALATVKHGGAS